MKEESEENETITRPVISGEYIPRIIAEKGVKKGKEYLLMGEITVGRESNNSICLPQDRFVSRHHARIFFDRDRNAYLLEDYSRNGTIVNGKKIWHEKVKIKHCDRIEIGTKTRLWFFTKELGFLEWLKGQKL